jgi:hypothetical protein
VTARLAILWLGVAAVAAGALGPAWLSTRAASASAVRAQGDLDTTASLAARLATMESQLPAWAKAGSTTGESETVAQTIARILAEVGLPPSALNSLSPESTTAIGGSNLPEASRPQRVRHTATIEPVTLVQLGRVLDKWRAARPQWTVTSIEMAPLREPDAKSGRRGVPLRVAISVESVRPGPGASPPRPAPRQ